MISVDEALDIVIAQTRVIGCEQVALPAALGRVLAEDIVSRRQHPPWDNSAMDGYAVRWQDIRQASAETPARLDLIGEVQAGGLFDGQVGPGQAVRIMTGAPTPSGADTVVRVEDTREPPSDGPQASVEILGAPAEGANVRRRGEDIEAGQVVIPAGRRCRPAEIGMLATADRCWAPVRIRPRIGVLATGNELAEPGMLEHPGQIIDSNAHALAAQCEEAGGQAVVIPSARDERADLEARLERLLTHDIAIVAGGVSVGKYDFVKPVLADMGLSMKFWRVRMRPGHPVAFGVLFASDDDEAGGGRLLFGLPGNPVSCMVAFYEFVRPAIRHMLGQADLQLPEVEAVLVEDIRVRGGRRHFARAITEYVDGEYRVRLTGDQGSGILTSMVQANSLLILPEEGGEFRVGDRLRVQLLPD